MIRQGISEPRGAHALAEQGCFTVRSRFAGMTPAYTSTRLMSHERRVTTRRPSWRGECPPSRRGCWRPSARCPTTPRIPPLPGLVTAPRPAVSTSSPCGANDQAAATHVAPAGAKRKGRDGSQPAAGRAVDASGSAGVTAQAHVRTLARDPRSRRSWRWRTPHEARLRGSLEPPVRQGTPYAGGDGSRAVGLGSSGRLESAHENQPATSKMT
jgi:hypothetical protein